MKSRIALIFFVTALMTSSAFGGVRTPAKDKSVGPWQRPLQTPPAMLTTLGLGLLAAGSATRRSVISRA